MMLFAVKVISSIQTNGEGWLWLVSSRGRIFFIWFFGQIRDNIFLCFIYFQICDEFYRQGDYERQLNLPVTGLCDRYVTSVAKIQTGMIYNYFQFQNFDVILLY